MLLIVLVVVSMFVCGGSDLSSIVFVFILGVVIGSYFEYVKVCIDVNNNGKCDLGEISIYIDVNGVYMLVGFGFVIVEIGMDVFCNDLDIGVYMVIM